MPWTIRKKSYETLIEALLHMESGQRDWLYQQLEAQTARTAELANLREVLFRAGFEAHMEEHIEIGRLLYEAAWSLSDDRELGLTAVARGVYALSHSPALQAELVERCRQNPPIYITGCARSGTTLTLRCIGGTITNADILWQEAWIAALLLHPPGRMKVLKRGSTDRLFFDLVPRDVRIVHVVRHPADICTSYLPGTRNYYVSPQRWLSEFNAAKQLFAAHPSGNVFALRYEDLLLHPDRVQQELASKLGVEFDFPFSSHHERAHRDTTVDKEGRRATWPELNTDSAYQHRRSKEHAERIGMFTSELGTAYFEFCNLFGYEP